MYGLTSWFASETRRLFFEKVCEIVGWIFWKSKSPFTRNRWNARLLMCIYFNSVPSIFLELFIKIVITIESNRSWGKRLKCYKNVRQFASLLSLIPQNHLQNVHALLPIDFSWSAEYSKWVSERYRENANFMGLILFMD